MNKEKRRNLSDRLRSFFFVLRVVETGLSGGEVPDCR